MADGTSGRPAPDRREIVGAVCAELAKHNTVGADLSEETDIAAELAIDSVTIMDLVFELEEQFDIAVPLNQMEDVRTVGQLADLVASLAGSGQQEDV